LHLETVTRQEELGAAFDMTEWKQQVNTELNWEFLRQKLFETEGPHGDFVRQSIVDNYLSPIFTTFNDTD